MQYCEVLQRTHPEDRPVVPARFPLRDELAKNTPGITGGATGEGTFPLWKCKRQLNTAMAAVRAVRQDREALDSKLNDTELESYYPVAGATLLTSLGSVQSLCLKDFRRFKPGRAGDGSYLCTRGFSAVGHLMSASPNVAGSDGVFVFDEAVREQVLESAQHVTVGRLLRAIQVSHRTPQLT